MNFYNQNLINMITFTRGINIVRTEKVQKEIDGKTKEIISTKIYPCKVNAAVPSNHHMVYNEETAVLNFVSRQEAERKKEEKKAKSNTKSTKSSQKNVAAAKKLAKHKKNTK